ncbi:ABC transporter ATP-binding protein [Protaetiibacter sp. SSC-01]|nr:ABC transporter ATP-binding protein [Protaetiibacter sp. SSC-01]
MSIDEGDRVAVLGANGAGKSTLLRTISGLIKFDGAVRFGGRDLAGRRPHQIVRAGVAHVAEGRGTFGQLTVEENLRAGAFTRSGPGVADDIDRVYGYFPVLRDRAKGKAAALSGGEQQMLAIGRALMLRPSLLLLDEPSLGLAPKMSAEVFRILREIHADSGMAVLVVEQNAELALDFVDRAYVLETGRVVMQGSSEELRSNSDLRRAYLGY